VRTKENTREGMGRGRRAKGGFGSQNSKKENRKVSSFMEVG
jgi:hypothetical protein